MGEGYERAQRVTRLSLGNTIVRATQRTVSSERGLGRVRTETSVGDTESERCLPPQGGYEVDTYL